MANSKMIDISVYIRSKKEKATRVEPVYSTRNSAWLPNSQIELAPTKATDIWTLTLPEWLAVEKGLV